MAVFMVLKMAMGFELWEGIKGRWGIHYQCYFLKVCLLNTFPNLN